LCTATYFAINKSLFAASFAAKMARPAATGLPRKFQINTDG
jgi:hypothetical protein